MLAGKTEWAASNIFATTILCTLSIDRVCLHMNVQHTSKFVCWSVAEILNHVCVMSEGRGH